MVKLTIKFNGFIPFEILETSEHGEKKDEEMFSTWATDVHKWRESTLSGSNVPYNPLDPRRSRSVTDFTVGLAALQGIL